MIIANKKTIKLETSYSVYSKCLQQVKFPTENKVYLYKII